jgi:hypothetical protein
MLQYNILCRLSKGPTCKWIDNIKMDLAEIGLGGVDWIGGELL